MFRWFLLYLLLFGPSVWGALFKKHPIEEECQSCSQHAKEYEKFWNLDPYRLDALCAYHAIYHDEQSSRRIRQLFPQLENSEVFVFVCTILGAGKTDYRFSVEEIALMRKLSCPGLSLGFLDELVEVDPNKDLARALILAEFPGNLGKKKAAYYSGYLDVLALRIHAERQRYFDQCPCALGTPVFHKATLEAINTILFYEEGIRYPSKKEMFSDEYSFLSSVTDRKFGVCLGISSLYFALSQRLDLPLEAVTPPGHIYLRYQGGEVNIETTAGGRHLATKDYCNCLDIEKLQVRTPTEMIGLTFMNQGSFALQKEKYVEAEIAYEKAQQYLKDEELKELLGIVKILSGKKKEGKALLEQSCRAKEPGSVANDYLTSKINTQTLALLFHYPGSTYQEVAHYETELKQAMKRSPECSEGLRRLVSIAFHLGKIAEGVALLERCADLSPNDLSLHLKLCKILCDRYDYAKALKYFLVIEALVTKQGLSKEELHSFTLFHEIQKVVSTIAP
ncbi:transglutaminase family protein [Candidatus Chlamydia sanziniae]|uniref:Protein SirB1 N-terminal domain-containing protein n=1 Tax=Candidatus Chlamydia sanziniae TaxID=1806891 RepID=A0A1A9HVR0_9CHLA|nr:transglutaminase family protein [Candidatus Chlamydia sanziniae]ANH78925.1 hypothetical protein Cs308_0755 [Candidatus Chlamydia sanziniae]